MYGIFTYMKTIKINPSWIGKYTVRPMDPMMGVEPTLGTCYPINFGRLQMFLWIVSWEPKVPPQGYPPPINKALLRDD